METLVNLNRRENGETQAKKLCTLPKPTTEKPEKQIMRKTKEKTLTKSPSSPQRAASQHTPEKKNKTPKTNSTPSKNHRKFPFPQLSPTSQGVLPFKISKQTIIRSIQRP